MKPQTIKIVIEYEGTNFAGWQVQPEQRTVQGEIEKVIGIITGQPVKITGAGRTDAGVHALGQVAHFTTDARLDPYEWVGAMNAHLPGEISVLDAFTVSGKFDARRSARGKWYRYEVSDRRVAPAIDRDRVWHVSYNDIDIEAMRKAAAYLVGEHDFTSFKGSGCASKSPVRIIRKLDVTRVDENRITFDIIATAFLKHMVRNIVGTLIEAGRGRWSPEDIKSILDKCDRTLAGPTAPPQGLTLMEIYYSIDEESKD